MRSFCYLLFVVVVSDTCAGPCGLAAGCLVFRLLHLCFLLGLGCGGNRLRLLNRRYDLCGRAIVGSRRWFLLVLICRLKWLNNLVGRLLHRLGRLAEIVRRLLRVFICRHHEIRIAEAGGSHAPRHSPRLHGALAGHLCDLTLVSEVGRVVFVEALLGHDGFLIE